jgi:hypothetical protein
MNETKELPLIGRCSPSASARPEQRTASCRGLAAGGRDRDRDRGAEHGDARDAAGISDHGEIEPRRLA